MTGRVERLSAAPCTAPSPGEKPSGDRDSSASTAAIPPDSHRSRSIGSSQHPVARMEMPRGPVRRTTPRTTSNQEWKTVAA